MNKGKSVEAKRDTTYLELLEYIEKSFLVCARVTTEEISLHCKIALYLQQFLFCFQDNYGIFFYIMNVTYNVTCPLCKLRH